MTQNNSFGAEWLADLLKHKHISQEQYDFITCETQVLTYLQHVKNLNDFATGDFLEIQTFWREMSAEFSEGRRGLFWRLLMKFFSQVQERLVLLVDEVQLQENLFIYNVLSHEIAYHEKKPLVEDSFCPNVKNFKRQ